MIDHRYPKKKIFENKVDFSDLNFPMCDPGGWGVSQKSKFLSFVFKNLRFLSPMRETQLLCIFLRENMAELVTTSDAAYLGLKKS